MRVASSGNLIGLMTGGAAVSLQVSSASHAASCDPPAGGVRHTEMGRRACPVAELGWWLMFFLNFKKGCVNETYTVVGVL